MTRELFVTRFTLALSTRRTVRTHVAPEHQYVAPDAQQSQSTSNELQTVPISVTVPLLKNWRLYSSSLQSCSIAVAPFTSTCNKQNICSNRR